MIYIHRYCRVPFVVGRHISSLINTHQNFLGIIRNQGSGQITSTKNNHIVEIVISNPEKKNALSGRMIYQLANLVDDLLLSPSYNETVGLIIRGDRSGGAFCAGLDFSTALENSDLPEFAPMMCNLMTDLLTRIQCANIVSVAFVEGYALGGGAELSTSCDYRMLTSDSYIGFVHARLGASPGWGGGRRLYDIVGRSNTLRMLGTGKIMSAQEALDIGLASSVVPSRNELIKIDENDSNIDAVEAAYEFLNEFASMKYPVAVKDLKALVSSLSVDHSPVQMNRTTPVDQSEVANTTSRLMQDVHSSILNSSRVKAEKSMFFKRWGSKENADALSGKKK